MAHRDRGVADGGGVAAHRCRSFVHRGAGPGGDDLLDRAAPVWRRCRTHGGTDRRDDGRRVRDGALGGARHDAFVGHRRRHGGVRPGRARWSPERLARLLRSCGSRVLGQGPRRASAARRRGRLPARDLRLAGRDAHAIDGRRRDARSPGRALVGSRGPRRAGAVPTGRGVGRYDARLQPDARADLEAFRRALRNRRDDPASVVPLASLRNAVGGSTLEDSDRGGGAIGARLGDHRLPRRRRVVPAAMALLSAALCAGLLARRGLARVPSNLESDGDRRRRLGRDRRVVGDR